MPPPDSSGVSGSSADGSWEQAERWLNDIETPSADEKKSDNEVEEKSERREDDGGDVFTVPYPKYAGEYRDEAVCAQAGEYQNAMNSQCDGQNDAITMGKIKKGKGMCMRGQCHDKDSLAALIESTPRRQLSISRSGQWIFREPNTRKEFTEAQYRAAVRRNVWPDMLDLSRPMAFHSLPRIRRNNNEAAGTIAYTDVAGKRHLLSKDRRLYRNHVWLYRTSDNSKRVVVKLLKDEDAQIYKKFRNVDCNVVGARVLELPRGRSHGFEDGHTVAVMPFLTGDVRQLALLLQQNRRRFDKSERVLLAERAGNAMLSIAACLMDQRPPVYYTDAKTDNLLYRRSRDGKYIKFIMGDIEGAWTSTSSDMYYTYLDPFSPTTLVILKRRVDILRYFKEASASEKRKFVAWQVLAVFLDVLVTSGATRFSMPRFDAFGRPPRGQDWDTYFLRERVYKKFLREVNALKEDREIGPALLKMLARIHRSVGVHSYFAETVRNSK